MGIEELHRKVVDTMSEEQLQALLSKYRQREQEARERGDIGSTEAFGRSAERCELRLARVRGSGKVC